MTPWQMFRFLDDAEQRKQITHQESLAWFKQWYAEYTCETKESPIGG